MKGPEMPCRYCPHCRKADGDTDTARRRVEIRKAIDGCRRCDEYGRLDDQSDCPHHENFRTFRPDATETLDFTEPIHERQCST